MHGHMPIYMRIICPFICAPMGSDGYSMVVLWLLPTAVFASRAAADKGVAE